MSSEAAVHWRRRHSWALREILSLLRLFGEEKALYTVYSEQLLLCIHCYTEELYCSIHIHAKYGTAFELAERSATPGMGTLQGPDICQGWVRYPSLTICLAATLTREVCEVHCILRGTHLAFSYRSRASHDNDFTEVLSSEIVESERS